jgi:hypothetical protein
MKRGGLKVHAMRCKKFFHRFSIFFTFLQMFAAIFTFWLIQFLSNGQLISALCHTYKKRASHSHVPFSKRWFGFNLLYILYTQAFYFVNISFLISFFWQIMKLRRMNTTSVWVSFWVHSHHLKWFTEFTFTHIAMNRISNNENSILKIIKTRSE